MMTVIPINPKAGIWGVDSETGHRTYTVSGNGEGTCTCPHSLFRAAPDCKHRAAVRAYLAEQTALQKAADRAANLTDEELLHWAKAKGVGPEAAACWLELARRRNLVKAENQPEVDLASHTCTCREFIGRRDGKRIGVLFVTCRHLQAAKAAAGKPEPNPIPAGVECFLEGATEAERERALAVYR